jgi:DNA polymerase III sliding clamp (beta) subunit (PCNA family)
LRCYVQAEVDSAYSGSVCTCVDFRSLRWLFNTTKEKEVSIVFGAKGGCKFISGDTEITAPTEDASNFPKKPDMPIGGTDYKAIFAAKEIVPALSRALCFVSNDDLRPAMTGVNVRNYNRQITVAATDAHRLYYQAIENYDGILNVVLERKFCQFVIEAFQDGFEFECAGQYSVASSSRYTIYSRLIDARYPDWPTILQNYSIEVLFDRNKAVENLLLMSFYANRSTNLFKITVTKNELIFQCGDNDFTIGATSKVPVHSVSGMIGQDFVFGINASFLLQALRLNKNPVAKLLHTGTITKSMTFDDNILIMPLLVNEAL